MTGVGTLLGTAAYMSPEQAKGRLANKQSDIWAFGCVLYEMLAGRRAFEGEETSDVLAAILRGEPDWSKTPSQLQRLLKACLEKDRRTRLQSIGDYRLLIIEAGTSAPVSRRTTAWMAATVVTTIAAIAIGTAYVRQRSAAQPARRLSLALLEGGFTGFIALSPDGRQLAVTTGTAETPASIWTRAMTSLQWQMWPGTIGARSIFWSPDSRSIAFFADGKLKIAPAGGGPTQVLCDAGVGGGGTWSRDGTILFGDPTTGSIYRVQASGGACEPVVRRVDKNAGGIGYNHPFFLPDGRHFLYRAQGADTAKSGIFASSLDAADGRRLLPDVSSTVFVPAVNGGARGTLLFLRNDKLLAQPFDADAQALSGDPIVVAEQASLDLSGGAAMSVAADGTLVYLTAPPRLFQLTWFDRSGKQIGKVGVPHDDRHMVLAPDEKSVAISRAPDQGPGGIWFHDLARDVETRGPNPGAAFVWAPDGSHVAFNTLGDLDVQDTAGGNPTTLIHGANLIAPSDWSQDGRSLIYTVTDPKTQSDIWVLSEPLGQNRKAVPFLQTQFTESQARLSPDGHWIAYTSDESGRFEIYVRPFPSGPGKWRVSLNGGREPAWVKRGRELMYADLGGGRYRINAVEVSAVVDRFETRMPQPLFDFATLGTVQARNMFVYTPTKDGSKFLALVQSGATQPALNVILNWQQLLEHPSPP